MILGLILTDGQRSYLLDREHFLLLGVVDTDAVWLLLWLLLELCDDDGAVVDVCDVDGAMGVSTWGTGCLLALKAAALMVYWWHWGGFHKEPLLNILNFSVRHFVGESPCKWIETKRSIVIECWKKKKKLRGLGNSQSKKRKYQKQPMNMQRINKQEHCLYRANQNKPGEWKTASTDSRYVLDNDCQTRTYRQRFIKQQI